MYKHVKLNKIVHDKDLSRVSAGYTGQFINYHRTALSSLSLIARKIVFWSSDQAGLKNISPHLQELSVFLILKLEAYCTTCRCIK